MALSRRCNGYLVQRRMKSLWATVKRHGRRSVGGIVVSAPNSAQDEVRHGNTAPTASGAGRGVEKRTIDMVPDGERHGTPKSQFTLWFGAVSYTHLTLPTTPYV